MPIVRGYSLFALRIFVIDETLNAKWRRRISRRSKIFLYPCVPWTPGQHNQATQNRYERTRPRTLSHCNILYETRSALSYFPRFFVLLIFLCLFFIVGVLHWVLSFCSVVALFVVSSNQII